MDSDQTTITITRDDAAYAFGLRAINYGVAGVTGLAGLIAASRFVDYRVLLGGALVGTLAARPWTYYNNFRTDRDLDVARDIQRRVAGDEEAWRPYTRVLSDFVGYAAASLLLVGAGIWVRGHLNSAGIVKDSWKYFLGTGAVVGLGATALAGASTAALMNALCDYNARRWVNDDDVGLLGVYNLFRNSGAIVPENATSCKRGGVTKLNPTYQNEIRVGVVPSAAVLRVFDQGLEQLTKGDLLLSAALRQGSASLPRILLMSAVLVAGFAVDRKIAGLVTAIAAVHILVKGPTLIPLDPPIELSDPAEVDGLVTVIGKGGPSKWREKVWPLTLIGNTAELENRSDWLRRSSVKTGIFASLLVGAVGLGLGLWAKHKLTPGTLKYQLAVGGALAISQGHATLALMYALRTRVTLGSDDRIPAQRLLDEAGLVRKREDRNQWVLPSQWTSEARGAAGKRQ